MTPEQPRTKEDLNIFLTTTCVKRSRQEFRKAFIEYYPVFMYRLREAVPEITAGEEILCMLIYLNQSNNDIAAILSICRKSVKQARYRLRSKIGLPPHVALDVFVHQLVVENKGINNIKIKFTL